MIALLLLACTSERGWLTIVNTGTSTINVNVAGRPFTLRPANHITKSFSAGALDLTYESGSMKIEIRKGLTTVLDSTGMGCFVAADFTDRYKGGGVKILERFSHKSAFTIGEPTLVEHGAPLPHGLGVGKRAIRLHQVDCGDIENDAKIIQEIGTLP